MHLVLLLAGTGGMVAAFYSLTNEDTKFLNFMMFWALSLLYFLIIHGRKKIIEMFRNMAASLRVLAILSFCVVYIALSPYYTILLFHFIGYILAFPVSLVFREYDIFFGSPRCLEVPNRFCGIYEHVAWESMSPMIIFQTIFLLLSFIQFLPVFFGICGMVLFHVFISPFTYYSNVVYETTADKFEKSPIAFCLLPFSILWKNDKYAHRFICGLQTFGLFMLALPIWGGTEDRHGITIAMTALVLMNSIRFRLLYKLEEKEEETQRMSRLSWIQYLLITYLFGGFMLSEYFGRGIGLLGRKYFDDCIFDRLCDTDLAPYSIVTNLLGFLVALGFIVALALAVFLLLRIYSSFAECHKQYKDFKMEEESPELKTNELLSVYSGPMHNPVGDVRHEIPMKKEKIPQKNEKRNTRGGGRNQNGRSSEGQPTVVHLETLANIQDWDSIASELVPKKDLDEINTALKMAGLRTLKDFLGSSSEDEF
ncbi:hypothetical protein GEMRC1_000948 [Eukaryota sp. GEM-RC1]